MVFLLQGLGSGTSFISIKLTVETRFICTVLVLMELGFMTGFFGISVMQAMGVKEDAASCFKIPLALMACHTEFH